MRALSIWVRALARTVALTAAMALTCVHAGTIVINFDTGTDITGGPDPPNPVPTYIENGVAFSQYACAFDLSTLGFVTSPFGPGKALNWDPASCFSDLIVQRTGGGTFDLVSLDTAMATPYDLVQGCKPGELPHNLGGSVPCSFGFEPGGLPSHEVPNNWTGLAYVDFCTYCLLGNGASGGIIDNFTITVPTPGVPEPGTLLLFGVGVALLGFSRRRQ